MRIFSRLHIAAAVSTLTVFAATSMMPMGTSKPVMAAPRSPNGSVPVWSKTFAAAENSTSYQTEIGVELTATGDSGMVFMGVGRDGTTSSVPGRAYSVLGRLSPNGTLLWSKYSVFGPVNTYASNAIVLPNGDILVAGRTIDDLATSDSAWLARFDGDGNTLSKTYFRLNDGPSGFYRMLRLQDGNLALIGQRYRASGEPAGGTGSVLMITTENGEVLTETLLTQVGLVQSFAETPDGGFVLVGGRFRRNGMFGQEFDAEVTRLTRQGNLVWQRLYGGGNLRTSMLQSVAPVTAGGFIAFGDLDTADPNVPTDTWLLRLDNDGNVLWQRSFGHPMRDDNDAGLVVLGNTFVIAGNAQSYFFVPPQGTFSSQVTSVPWLVRVNGVGDIIWMRQYGQGSVTRIFSTGLENMVLAPDDTLLTMGGTADFGVDALGERNVDYWAMKLSTDGLIGSRCGMISTPVLSSNVTTATHTVSATLSISLTRSTTSTIEAAVVDWSLPISSTQCSDVTPIIVPSKRFVYVPLVRR